MLKKIIEYLKERRRLRRIKEQQLIVSVLEKVKNG